MNNGTNSNNNTSFNDSSGRDMDGTARSHSYIPEFQNMAAAVDQFHSHEDNCMSTDIGSAFSQISNLHPQLLTDSFMAEDMPFGDYNDEQQQQQQFDASPVGDPEPESPFQTLEPASGHFPFDTYQDALGYVPIAMKTEVPDGPFAQLQLQQQVLPAQLHDVSSLSRLPDSPSQWEDIQFKFDTQAQMMTLSGGARATGPIAIKQEVGERPLNACAFAAPAAGLDVKQNLRATIRQRRASRGLSHNPTMALSRPQQMKLSPDDMMRKERRKEQNRRAAQKCREKKRHQSKQKERNYERIITENRDRKQEVEQLKKEVARLSRALDEHKATCPLLVPAGKPRCGSGFGN